MKDTNNKALALECTYIETDSSGLVKEARVMTAAGIQVLISKSK